MAKTSNVFKCPHCDYSTPRKYNLTLHLNKKKPCKPKETESIDDEILRNCNENVTFVTPVRKNVTVRNDNVTLDNNNAQTTRKGLTCPTCGVVFLNRQAKYRHVKKAQCKPPDSRDDKVDQLEAQIHELRAALTQKGQVVHNTYNITNSMTNNTSNTNNIINYNNFDSPNFDHITKEMIGEMYLKADRELPRMIGHAVRKIYKGLPENDTIRFKYGNQAGFAEVRQDDETRILPVSDVLETVLSQASTLCGKELMKCCGPNMIPGPNVVNHAQELSVLHWGFVPETHAKRQGYFKFVKSALL